MTVTSVSTIDGYPRLRSSGPALAAGARACDAVLRLLDSAEPNLPAYNLLCRYLALLDDPSQTRERVESRGGALLPAQAGSGRGVHPRAGILRPLRRGRAPRRLLRRRRWSGLRQLRSRLLRARPRRRTASWSRRWPSRWSRHPAGESALRQVERAVGETLEHHAHVQLRAGGIVSAAPGDRHLMIDGARHHTLRRSCPAWEAEFLAEHATRSYPAERRRAEPDSPLRTPFQRDRDRIVHSKSFRRLKHKTQVFVAPEGDHYRTRLTHTLEACGIARTVARALGLNEDLTEAIGLGHDLGHPPFGHAGEEALDAACGERCGGSFRHNEHSLRVVEVLERDGAGST